MTFRVTNLYPVYIDPQYAQNAVNSNRANLGFRGERATTDAIKADVSGIKKAIEPIDNFSKKVNDLDKETLDSSKVALEALGVIPTARRLGSVPDSIESGDNFRTAGMISLAALNLPGDLRELRLAGKEIKDMKNIFKSTSKNALKGYQYPFNFLRRTFVEKFAQRSNVSKEAFEKFSKYDKTLYGSKFGKSIRKSLNIKPEARVNVAKEFGVANKKMTARKFGGNFGQKLVGRSLMRIPIIGLGITAALEIPALVKSVTRTEGSTGDKLKALGKQLLKSAGYITLVTAGIAVVGAAASIALPAVGAIASLVGMAGGSFLGLTASRALNKQIDKIGA